jgi:GT2 family glycosyltransferase
LRGQTPATAFAGRTEVARGRNGTAPSAAHASRASARGKFLFHGDEKLYVRGVTYGTFREDFPAGEVVAQDFSAMRASGVNAVRVYTVPPRWLLDLAYEHGLLVMVGIPWEQHIAFLDDRGRSCAIEQRVREGVRACAGHPAVLCYAVGNEIPASIVRWHGRRPIERFIKRLYDAAKAEDPEALVTYVNFPSTEYLELPFLDLVCFNVYLEAEELLDAYIARLQNLAGDRPLVLAEVGLDSRRHGDEGQAAALAWQLHTAYTGGCAGTFVFAWTDEWHRGDHDIDDWDFGLVDRAREPKPALAAVETAFAEVPFRDELDWPTVTVAVCVHNEADTLHECLAGIAELDYPAFETIVVDDGSTDESAAIAAIFEDVRLIRTPNQGLAAARNEALAAARGEIVAFIDGDATPDPHWLRYLAASFMTTPHAGIGGPNILPENSGVVAECVALSPGGPTHVLVSDREAEHIPGCNMAFRKDALDAIGGFDPQFHAAGDDVDICWRLHDRGWTLGFSPAAVVLHHRRNSVRAYLRQQRGYGKAEAMLERKWPEKYNRAGHASWAGRLYGGGAPRRSRWRIYYGTWGSALFQSLYERTPGTLASLPLMPEWYLLIAFLTGLSAYSFAWDPIFFTVPPADFPFSAVLLALAVLTVVVQAVRSAASAGGVTRRALTALLHLVQPPARLWGRLREGLTPWRQHGPLRVGLPRPRSGWIWSESWRSPQEWLQTIEAEFRPHTTGVLRGGNFDRWDLHVRSGPVGGARVRVAIEEHGEGRQLLRYRVWPWVSRGGIAIILVAAGLSALSAVRGSASAFVALTALALLVLLRMLHEVSSAVPLAVRTLAEQGETQLALDDELVRSAHRARFVEVVEVEE